MTYEDSVDHPIFEPAPGEIRLWAMVRIKALFDDEVDRDAISAYFAEQVAVPSFYFESVPDTNWVRASMDQFKAQRFGTRLWVVPSWLQAPQDEEAVGTAKSAKSAAPAKKPAKFSGTHAAAGD